MVEWLTLSPSSDRVLGSNTVLLCGEMTGVKSFLRGRTQVHQKLFLLMENAGQIAVY